MQVYVHLAGKNHGPYSIDQLRQYVQAGNFRDDHLACYDGTNWVKIKDVPGFAVVAYKAKNRTQELLSDAKTIELKNPQRDKYFRVLAEVWIDGESLSEKLKSDGLAKDYDGEGLDLSGEWKFWYSC